MAKLKCTVTFEYEVNPGTLGYAECSTVDECVRLDNTLLNDDENGDYIFMIMEGADLTISVEPA